MRKLLAVSLAALAASFGVPRSLSAEKGAGGPSASVATASISGSVLDAFGRGVAGHPVELLVQGSPVQATSSGPRGEYSFARVVAGEYVVRVIANGMPAGIRVPVSSDAAVTAATIVLPAAAAVPGEGSTSAGAKKFVVSVPTIGCGTWKSCAVAGTAVVGAVVATVALIKKTGS